jgi:hypothetical protein
MIRCSIRSAYAIIRKMTHLCSSEVMEPRGNGRSMGLEVKNIYRNAGYLFTTPS